MAVNMTEDLKGGMEWKPCPFCNGTELMLSEDRKGYYEEPVVQCAYVACRSCKGEMWVFSHDIQEEDAEYEDIIRTLNEKWNRRAGS